MSIKLDALTIEYDDAQRAIFMETLGTEAVLNRDNLCLLDTARFFIGRFVQEYYGFGAYVYYWGYLCEAGYDCYYPSTQDHRVDAFLMLAENENLQDFRRRFRDAERARTNRKGGHRKKGNRV